MLERKIDKDKSKIGSSLVGINKNLWLPRNSSELTIFQ